jgi:chromosome segregation ATPase
MKLKLTIIAFLTAFCQITFAQETKEKETKIEDIETSLDNAKERLKTAQKELVRNTEKFNKSLSSGELSPNEIAEYKVGKQQLEERIENLKTLIVTNIARIKQEEANKVVIKKQIKEKAKAEKRAKTALKEEASKRKKLEEQQRKLDRERKLLEKKNQKIAEVKNELDQTNKKLEDTKEKVLKNAEKYAKDLEKGNLSPNDISNYEKEKTILEEKIDVLKDKVSVLENKLAKVSE